MSCPTIGCPKSFDVICFITRSPIQLTAAHLCCAKTESAAVHASRSTALRISPPTRAMATRTGLTNQRNGLLCHLPVLWTGTVRERPQHRSALPRLFARTRWIKLNVHDFATTAMICRQPVGAVWMSRVAGWLAAIEQRNRAAKRAWRQLRARAVSGCFGQGKYASAGANIPAHVPSRHDGDALPTWPIHRPHPTTDGTDAYGPANGARRLVA